MIVFRRLGLSLILIAGLAFMSLTAAGLAQGPKKDGGKKEPAPASSVNWHEKKIAFEMRGQLWRNVFEWLSDQSGMPYASPYPPPPGTLTFINPKLDGKPREYTLSEIYDIINEVLQSSTKHTLIRRETILTMYPADAEIPDYVFPLVGWEDLEKHGKTEIVRTVVQVKNLNVEDVAGTIKKQLDEFGKVTPLPDDNKLILRGTVASLIFIKKYIIPTDNPDKEPPSANTLVYQCVFIRATTAKAILTESLGAQQVVLRVGAKEGGGAPETGGAPPGVPGGPGGPPTKGSGGQTAQRSVRPHTISVDKASNKVIVHGPIDKVRQAKDVLKDIDKGQPGQKGLLVGPREYRKIDLPAGGAATTVKILEMAFKDDPDVRIMEAGPSSIFVSGDPQTQLEMGLFIAKELQPTRLMTVFLRLTRLEPGPCEAMIKAMLKDGPYVEANKDNNGLMVRGTTEQINEVKNILKALDENPFEDSGTSRMINLEKGSGATVAEALAPLLKDLHPNMDIKVNRPGQLESKPQQQPKEEKKVEKKTIQWTPDKMRELIYADKTQPVSFQDEKQPAKKKGQITIQGFGNRILITSDDPKALDEAQQLIRLLVNTEAGPGDFEVIQLKTANAVEVAKILDEAYNGPKNQGGQGGSNRGGGTPGGFGLLLGSGFGGGGGGQSSRVEIIRVVADAYTNALLIRAKPVDIMTIRRLIKNSLDIDNVNSEQVVKTQKIKLQYANAASVAENIKQLYAQHMQPRQQTTPGSGSGFLFGGGARPVESTGTPSTVNLTVSVDDGNNTILVHCPATLFKEIKHFVDEIEEAASKQSYAIVQPTNVDPETVRQLVDVMSGRNTMAGRRPGDTTSGSLASSPTFAPNPYTGRTFGTSGVGGGGPGGGGFGGFGGGGPGGGTVGSGSGIPGGGAFPAGIAPTFNTPTGGFGGGGPRGGGGGPTGGGGGTRGGGGPRGGQQSRGPDFFPPSVMDDRSGLAQLKPQERGRDFFASPVMDDRSAPVLYDPFEEQDEPPQQRDDRPFAPPVYTANPLNFATLLQDKVGGQGMMPDEKQGFRPPPISLKIDILQNGQLLLRGDDKDIKEFQKTLEYLQKKSEGTRVEIRLVAVRFQDPNTLTERLNQLYSKVQVDQTTTAIVNPATRPGGATGPAPAGAGAAAQPGGTPVPTATPSGPALNFVFLPQPRLGAILVAAPKALMPGVLEKIQMFDQKHSDMVQLVHIPLKRASAKDVAQAINTFFPSRFPGAENGVNFSNVRVTADTVSNTLIVQASPADLDDIRRFVEYIDNDNNNKARNEMRVVFLKNAVANDLGNLLYQAIANGTLTVNPTAGIFQTPVTTASGAGVTTVGGNFVPTIPMTKDSRLRFFSARDGKMVEAGILEDIRFQSDARTNSLIVIAPEKTMPLLLALINELDVAPIAVSKIQVFQLRRSDSTQVAIMLQQLFLGTGVVGQKAGGGGAAPGGGAPGGGGTARPLTFTISGQTPEGAPIIDVRVTVDERTNTLIAAGSQNDLFTIGSVIARLEGIDVPRRINDTIKLRNANAVDVVNAVQTQYTNLTALYKTYNQATNSLGLIRDVLLQAEPISNCVMVSATPELFDEVVRQIAKMDTTPPMVVVSCLIAEVDLTDTEEFGVELGLQNPIAFLNGMIPGSSAVTYTSAAATATTPVPSGVTSTYNNFIPGPGLNFNQPSAGLPSQTLSPNAVQGQALSSFGVGRTSTNVAGVSGLVLSGGNQSINFLVRALKAQERITILSRPQIMTLDNQSAVVQIVTYFPIVDGGVTVTTGVVTAPPIVHQPLGVTLQVTPRITPDGRILMRVIPEVSGIQSTDFPLGNGSVATSYNVEHLETSVSAYDGDTILIGGLIQKKVDKVENKVPVLGDLPYVGWLWRYRTDVRSKTELIFIMTPHIVASRMDAQQIMLDESRRISWDLPDVAKVHGVRNCEVFMPADVPHMPYGNSPPKTPNMMPALDVAPANQPRSIMPAAQTFAPTGPTTNAPVAPLPPYVETAPPGQSDFLRGGLLQKMFGAKNSSDPVLVYTAPAQGSSGAPSPPPQPVLPPLPPVMSAGASGFITPAPPASPPPAPANVVLPAQTYYPPRGPN